MSDKYYHTKESVEEYIKLSKGYDGSRLINVLTKHLPAGSTVLELGSAEGKDIVLLKSHNYRVVGSDYSKEFLEVLKKKCPETELLRLNASTLTTDKSFDAIYSNKVLHHLTDEELISSFKRQHELLNNGGLVCHSFWLGAGDEEFKGMYVNYHTSKDLTITLSSLFEILYSETYPEMEKDDSFFIVARKKTI